MGLNSRGLAEFNKAGCSPRLVSSAVLGSVRTTHMQIAAIKWDCQRSMKLCQCFSASVHISGGNTRSCKRMCCISQAVLLHCGLTLTLHSRDIDTKFGEE